VSPIKKWLTYKLAPSYLRMRDNWQASKYEKEKSKAADSLPDAIELPDVFEEGKYTSTRLFWTHGRGGGVDQHVEDICSLLEKEGVRCIIIHYEPFQRFCYLSRYNVQHPQKVMFRFPNRFRELLSTLKSLETSFLHIHNTRYLPYYFIKDLPNFAKSLGVPFDYFLHDFLPVCPLIYMVNHTDRYCGEPRPKDCNACIRKNGMLTAAPLDIVEWRREHGKIFKAAEGVYAPSEDTSDRIRNYYTRQKVGVRPHPEILPAIMPQRIRRREGELLRIAIVGAINQHKGADIILACVRDAWERELPIDFRIIGYTIHDEELGRYENVTVTGPYQDKELPRIFREHICHIAFFPWVYPETYSRSFTRAVLAGMYPVAFDLGSMAERIENIGWGEILPFPMIDDPSAINNQLLEIKMPDKPEKADKLLYTRYDNILADYYS